MNESKQGAGFGAYFGLILLFAIPVVGLIACIVCSFALNDRGLRNFSRATLVWMVVGILILALLAFVVVSALSFAADALLTALNDVTEGEISSFRDIDRLVEKLEDTVEEYGGLEKLISDLSELDAIAKELGGWDKIVEKLRGLEQTGEAAGDLGGLLEQMQGTG